MIAQAQDMELALESFAQEAANKVAQLWSERGNTPLTANQELGLVDGIWECLASGVRAGIESEPPAFMQAT